MSLGVLRQASKNAKEGLACFHPIQTIQCAMSALAGRITIDPEVCRGKPCVGGLRHPVDAMLEYLAEGDTIEDVLLEFPDLERDDLLACLEFALHRRTAAPIRIR
jgi:uncharacterized protein (DUF433 family)